uniref:Uncharacterized protein n=1 Tax=Micrurus spixii TaxID=129469 RepID=A0A2D4MZV3_9SAUR
MPHISLQLCGTSKGWLKATLWPTGWILSIMPQLMKLSCGSTIEIDIVISYRISSRKVQQKEKEEEPSRLKGKKVKREKQTILLSTLETNEAAPVDLLLLLISY